VIPEEHAIAYSEGKKPALLPGEQQLPKRAICIVMSNGEAALPSASRIHFGIHHPIQYNLKVKDIGCVHPDSLPAFLRYWKIEHNADLDNETVSEIEQAIDDNG